MQALTWKIIRCLCASDCSADFVGNSYLKGCCSWWRKRAAVDFMEEVFSSDVISIDCKMHSVEQNAG